MEGHPFSRPSRGMAEDNRDPFENMREQMEKDRENFFRGVNPREWPNDTNTSRGGIFNRPRTSFSGFPNGGTLGSAGPGMRVPRYVNDVPEDLDGFGNISLGGNSCAQPGYSTNSLGRPRKFSNSSGGREDDVSDHSSNCSGNSEQGDGSIPISVQHMSTSQQPKYRYGQQAPGSRKTTELPAKAASGDQSPRLERAHSEPPNKFNQRLNLAKPHYSTIPENTESYGNPNHLSAQNQDSTRNPIKPSASAPSVPTSNQGSNVGGKQESQPEPPPRKSPPRSSMQNQGALPTNSGANVRHIPIFVEGRPEPIFNTNINSGSTTGPDDHQNAAGQEKPFPKPSDYYPHGVQRIKSRDGTLTPDTPQFQGDKAPFMGQKSVTIPVQEPTTPQGPPPGSIIPMGYCPNQNTLKPSEQVVEPTTPQGPPPGPIPMGYVSNSNQETETSLPEPPTDPIPLPCASHLVEENQPPPPPTRNKSSMEHPFVNEPVTKSDLNGDIENKNISIDARPLDGVSCENPVNEETNTPASKEPVVNVIPIILAPGRAESPHPKSNSRAPSSEPQSRPGKSPTPSRVSPQPESCPPKDPKIAKLDKIKADVDVLLEKIENFKGTKSDKEYLYLDEMLTRHLIALDGVDPEGQQEIRQLRKESIKSVNRCLSMLDSKVSETNAEENNEVLSELAAKSKSDNDSSEKS